MFLNSAMMMPNGVFVGLGHMGAGASFAALLATHPATWIGGGAALLAAYRFVQYHIAHHAAQNSRRARLRLEKWEMPQGEAERQRYIEHELTCDELSAFFGTDAVHELWKRPDNAAFVIEKLKKEEERALAIRAEWRDGIDGWQGMLCSVAAISALLLIIAAV